MRSQLFLRRQSYRLGEVKECISANHRRIEEVEVGQLVQERSGIFMSFVGGSRRLETSDRVATSIE